MGPCDACGRNQCDVDEVICSICKSKGRGREGDSIKACKACGESQNLHMIEGVYLCLLHADSGFGSDTTGERML